jgi:kynurenine formamidase
VNEGDVLALFERCSNVGRWGPDDQLGTLNLVTPEKRRAAAGLVRTGRVVSLARRLRRDRSRNNPLPIAHRMLEGLEPDAVGSSDAVEIAPHGYAVTHLDALGHAFFGGRAWNGRAVADIAGPGGLSFADIVPQRLGVFTRGVLLDVARARGVAWLEPGAGVSVADLEAAEALAGLRVESGDAILVRVGLTPRERELGEEDPRHRAGLLPECIPWLHERGVAVYGGDCIEQLPSGYPSVPAPLHQIGLVAMGLVMLDNPELEELAEAVAAEGRAEFLLTCAPSPIPGATGSPVNPLAVF